jgi:hypothetical protein
VQKLAEFAELCEDFFALFTRHKAGPEMTPDMKSKLKTFNCEFKQHRVQTEQLGVCILA